MVADPALYHDGEFRPLFGHTNRVGPHSRKDLLTDVTPKEATFVPSLPHQKRLNSSLRAAAPPPPPPPPHAEVAPAPQDTIQSDPTLEDARLEAEQIVAAARAQADEIIASAEAEAVRLEDWVQEHTAAIVREEQEAAFAAEIAEFRASFAAARKEGLAMLANEVMSLVSDIAEKVIYRAAAADPEATLRAVTEALEELPGGGRIRLLVPAEDAESISEQRAALMALLREPSDIQVVSDESLRRGGCVVQSDRGDSDARLETRLATVREEIERVMA
jgi:flagellar assembly protein FliH